ncbi:MAG: hypothetical protein PVF83_19185 [Anaerolineales bacterium]|jgi:hypothetical protein
MTENVPVGEERKVEFLGGAAIDGAPIAFIIVFATVVLALAFFPISYTLAIGGSFPMSQGVLGLVGWVLGPVAGGVASGVGALAGVFLAPHTAGSIPFIRIFGSLFASFAAGTMVLGDKRRAWWFWPWLLALLSFLYFIGRALFINGVGLGVVVANTFVDWSALLLFALPTRTLIARWINSKKWSSVLAGLALGTWVIYGITHVCSSAIAYHVYNWPEEIWVPLILLIPFENLIRAVIGVVIGGGVIAGLRSLALVRPKHAIY